MTRFIFCLAFLCIFPFILRAQTEQDIERVNEEAFAAYEAYDYRTAIDKEQLILKWMGKKKKLQNDTNEVVVHINLGGFYQNYQRYDSARINLLEAKALCENYFGKKSELYINVALQLGGLYEAIDLLPEAEQINEEAIALIRQGATEDDWLIGAIYSNQAIVKKKLFKLKEALSMLEKSGEYTIRSSGRRSLDYANILNTRSLVYGEMGDLKMEESLLQDAMQLCRDLNATDKSLYSNVLNNMAVLMVDKGKYEQAVRYYQSAYRIKASIYSENSLECATVLANEGVAFGNFGRYEEGIGLVVRARKIVESLLGKFHPEWFQYCLYLGTIYEQAGMYQEIGLFYADLIRDSERELGEKSPVYLTVLNNAVNYYQEREEYDKCSKYYEVLLNNLDQLTKDFALTIKGNYANYLEQMGKWEEAGPIYREVLAGWENVKGLESEEYLKAKHNYGVYFQDLGQLSEAKKIFEETRLSLQNISGNKSSLILTLNENLAGIYSDENEYGKALRVYQDLLDIQQDQYGDESVNVADLFDKIGMCYTNLDNPDKGLEYIEKAYSMKVKLFGKDEPALSYELTLMGTSYTYRKDYKKGMGYFEEARRLIAQNFNTYFRFMTEQEKLKFLQKKMSELKQLQAIAAENVTAYPDFAGLAFDVELMMKGMVLESGNRLRQGILQSKDPVLMEKLDRLGELRSQVAAEMLKEVHSRNPNTSKLNEEADALEKELISSLGEQNQLDMQMDSWKSILRKLQKDEAVVEFISYQTFFEETPSLAAIVLNGNSTSPSLVPLFSEARLQAYLKQRKSGGDQDIVQAIYGESRGLIVEDEVNIPSSDDSLYLLVWKPLEKYLNTAKRVYYSPSGSLHKISFAAIRNEEGRYLSDLFILCTRSSSRKLLDKTPTFKMEDVCLVGGVDYDGDKGEQEQVEPEFVMRGGSNASPWKFLRGTQKEVEQIASVLQNAQTHTEIESGMLATEKEVKQKMSSGPSVIHLSTHGYFFPTPAPSEKERLSPFQSADNPLLRSGLILAGANQAWMGGPVRGEDDGILTAYEVANMNLSATRLAVLSACQTGLGDVEGSEGVFGLQRAFKQAGVEYIVMSLWQVPDKETVEFMTLFYQNMAKGNEIEGAFQEAQDVMRKNYAPYYWAAFVLMR
ncbi:MAG: CHAT domain-containing protein [Bacteroidetes bacterium]|nr:CHAT domain-containing protein [Bacteroidota bacterium]